MEEKSFIVYLLDLLLKATRFGSNINRMEYKRRQDNEEYVIVYYKPQGGNKGTELWVLVTADSGIAIIKDVLREIGA